MKFPYVAQQIRGVAPPTLAPGVQSRNKPLIRVRIYGPSASRLFVRALVDTGAEDTVFPLYVAAPLGVSLSPSGAYRVRWGGTRHELRFADVELELSDGIQLFQ